MSESAPRPQSHRGRGGPRNARGGSRRTPGTRGHDQSASAKIDEAEQGEIGQLRKKYKSQLSDLNQVLSDWTDEELLMALQDDDGDSETTLLRISAGKVPRFAEVEKKNRSRSKVKDPVNTASDSHSQSHGRGAGRNSNSERGRGRGDRGRSTHPRPPRRGPSENRNGPSTSNLSNELSAWDIPDPITTAPTTTQDSVPTAQVPTKTAPSSISASAVASPPVKQTWASMFASKLKQEPVPAPPPVQASPAPSAAVLKSDDPWDSENIVADDNAPSDDTEIGNGVTDSAHNGLPAKSTKTIDEPSSDLPPSKDKLTTDNVEHLPDVSQPAPTGTAASTVDSSRGVTPLAGAHAPIPIPLAKGGYAATLKSNAQRSASYQRRVRDQQEAVVMPADHPVAKTAVQFGSLSLDNDLNSPNIDDVREEAETRKPLVHDSPIAQPRASLPPAPRPESRNQEGGAAKPATAAHLPTAASSIGASTPQPQLQQPHQPTPQQLPAQQQHVPAVSSQQTTTAVPTHPQNVSANQSATHGHQQPNIQHYNNRFAQPDTAALNKPYDAFGQPAAGSDLYAAQGQASGVSANDFSYYNENQNQQRYNSPYYASYNTTLTGENTLGGQPHKPFSDNNQNAHQNQGQTSAAPSQTPQAPQGLQQHNTAGGHNVPNQHHNQLYAAHYGFYQHNAPNAPLSHPYYASQAYSAYPYSNRVQVNATHNNMPAGHGGFSYGVQGNQGVQAGHGLHGPAHGHGHPGMPNSTANMGQFDSSNAATGGQSGTEAFARGGFGEYGQSGSTQPRQQASQHVSNQGQQANSGSGFGEGPGQSTRGFPGQHTGFGPSSAAGNSHQQQNNQGNNNNNNGDDTSATTTSLKGQGVDTSGGPQSMGNQLGRPSSTRTGDHNGHSQAFGGSHHHQMGQPGMPGGFGHYQQQHVAAQQQGYYGVGVGGGGGGGFGNRYGRNNWSGGYNSNAH